MAIKVNESGVRWQTFFFLSFFFDGEDAMERKLRDEISLKVHQTELVSLLARKIMTDTAQRRSNSQGNVSARQGLKFHIESFSLLFVAAPHQKASSFLYVQSDACRNSEPTDRASEKQQLNKLSTHNLEAIMFWHSMFSHFRKIYETFIMSRMLTPYTAVYRWREWIKTNFINIQQLYFVSCVCSGRMGFFLCVIYERECILWFTTQPRVYQS